MNRFWTESLVHDLKLGLRMFRRNKAFAVVAVAILALGIGVSTSMFSLVNAALIRPLPYPEPDRLVRMWSTWTGFARAPFSIPEYFDYTRHDEAFDSVALHRGRRVSWTLPGGETESTFAEEVTGRFFEVLGVEAELGRLLLPEDDTGQGRRVVVVSRGFWIRRLGAAPGAVGDGLYLDGVRHTIVGVLPATFQYPYPGIDLWVPLALDVARLEDRGNRRANLVGRLKPDVRLSGARARMEAVAAELKRTYPEHYREDPAWGVRLELLQDYEREPYQGSLLLLAAGGLLLLIACANVANLLLARGSQRSREATLRVALGAPRPRLVRQFLTETAVLAAFGGVIGFLSAEILLRLLVGLNPDLVPRPSETHVDAFVGVFAAGVVILTALVSGLAPALQASRCDLRELLNSALRHSDAAREGKSSRVLLVAQVALAAALLCGAGLLGRSFLNLQFADLGFQVEGVTTAALLPDPQRYPENHQIAAFYEGILESLRSLPSLEAALVSIPPLSFSQSDQDVTVEGYDPEAAGNRFEQVRVVSSDYFKTLGIPLLRGRDFDNTDSASAPGVAVINQALAAKYWGDQDPLGRHMKLGGILKTVVGLAADILDRGGAEPPQAMVFVPLAQSPQRAMTLIAKSPTPPERLVPALRNAVKTFDPSQTLGSVLPLSGAFRNSTQEPRFNAFLVGLFAFLALALAASGLYGLLSYLVSRRSHEIGVRSALGARRRDIVLMIVAAGLRWTLAGLLLGSLASLLLGRYLESLLVGVAPGDLTTLAAVWLVLLSVALAASYAPARKAARSDPWKAIRQD